MHTLITVVAILSAIIVGNATRVVLMNLGEKLYNASKRS